MGATPQDTPKAVVTKTDEPMRSVSEEKAGGVQPAGASQPELKEGEDYGKGVIFYLRENKVVGVLLWNVFNRMSIARRILRRADNLTISQRLPSSSTSTQQSSHQKGTSSSSMMRTSSEAEVLVRHSHDHCC